MSPLDADWIADRERLWNQVEAAEKRYDAQLAREVTLAIPVELDRDAKINLVCEYVQQNFVDRGMIADINLHHLEGDNPHAHIMVTMRDLKIDEQGIVSFGNKNRDWNKKDLLIKHRESWATLANQYLVDAGHLDIKIDHRSNADRGIETIPQIHLGAAVVAMRQKGIATDRGNEYDRIDVVNHNIREKLEDIYASESATRDLQNQLAEYDHLHGDINRAKDAQRQKDRDIFAAVKANPDLRNTQDYKDALARKKLRFAPVPAPAPVPKSEPESNYLPKRIIDPQLIRSIMLAADRLGTDFQAGDYHVQLLGRYKIAVSYCNKLVMTITTDMCNARPTQSSNFDAYVLGLHRSIDLLLIHQPQSESEPEPELEPQLEPELELELQPQLELEPEPELQPQLELELEPEPEPELQPQAESEPEPELDIIINTKRPVNKNLSRSWTY